MIRVLTTSIVILLSYGWAQTVPPLVASRGAVNPNAVASSGIRPSDSNPRPLPDVPPLPAGKMTLLGGTIRRVDHIRDRLILDVFGGGHTTVLFDERTRVLHGDQSASLDVLKDGERVYVDTILDGTSIFARNIRIASAMPPGQGSGQIVGFEPSTGDLTLRDTLSPVPVRMRLASGASILRGDQTAGPSDLRPGTLVTLVFLPGKKGEALVRSVSIVASPGATFDFSGRVEYLDLHRGLLVLLDPRDNKSYELNFDPSAHRLTQGLRQGENVTVQSSFDGRRYEVRAITVNSPSSTLATGADH